MKKEKTPAYLTLDFAEKLQEMYGWYQSQLQIERLSPSGSRGRKPMGVAPFVLTEELDGTRLFAKARKLGVRRRDEQAQIVSVGPTATDGQFRLKYKDETSAYIDHDSDTEAFQDAMDGIFGSGNTFVSIGGGVWLVRMTGNLRNTEVDLMETVPLDLAGCEHVAVKKTPFNSEVQEILVCEFNPMRDPETLPIGTVGMAGWVSGVGWTILHHDQQTVRQFRLGKTDETIGSGSSATVSLYAGDLGTEIATDVNVEAYNRGDSIDADTWVLVYQQSGGWEAVPLEC